MNILEEIIEHKKVEVETLKVKQPISELLQSKYFNKNTISVSQKINQNSNPSIIAEFKRRSPSKENINLEADVLNTCKTYETNGATAISILSDEKYFGGNNNDITTVRDHISIPILRKEFIIDEYQIIEAKSIGADFILLIAECLTEHECYNLAKFANELGLEVLLEMHDGNHSYKINEYVQLIGINNRNLTNFKTDIQTSLDIISSLPDNTIKVSESGIKTKEEINLLFNTGYKAFLIGETIMKDPSIINSLTKK